MFTVLDLINRSLGYFNVNTKLKNQAYVVVGFFGEFYLLYVTVKLLQNGAWVRGILFGLAFLVLMYFVVLNFIYYYTDKRAKFDISPWIESKLGGPRQTEAEKRAAHMANMPNIPANGLFNDDQILPADVDINPHEQANLKRVVKQMVVNQVLEANYNNKSERDIVAESRDTHDGIHKLNENQVVPYFELVPNGQWLEIYIGMNQMERLAVGHLTGVGLTRIADARKHYDLFLANVSVTGGPEKVAGRSASTIEYDRPYGLNVTVAYKDKK